LEAATGHVPVSIQTQHAAARAAVENAAEYLAGKVSIPQVRLAVAAMGAGSALFLGRKPNVAPDEERMSTKQRFERQVTRTEKPLYFRVQARVSGMVDQATGATEEDLLTGAREAVGAHFAGGVDQNSHSTTDSRKKFSNRVLDGLADRLTNALYPLKD
jgi:RNA-splicing ligase RtcB